MPKLSEQQIVRVHQMAAQGVPVRDIAHRLDVHRNTIGRHLALQYRYSAWLLSQVRRKVWSKGLGHYEPVENSNRISLSDAAMYLPGWPSIHKIRQLRSDGVLSVSADPSGAFVTEAQIRRAARKMLPKGIYFDCRSIPCIFPYSQNLIEALSAQLVRSEYYPKRQFLPARAIVAAGYQPCNIPALVLSRVVESLRISGVATV